MTKMKKMFAMAAIGFAVAVSSGASAQAADGAKIFKKKCALCHKVGKNGAGPDLTGIVGRAAGTMKFKYSKPMVKKAEEGLVWTEENLNAFLTNPKKFIKKTRMAFPGFKKKKADLEAVMEYLKTL